jgi:pilus assembly protein CpaE
MTTYLIQGKGDRIGISEIEQRIRRLNSDLVCVAKVEDITAGLSKTAERSIALLPAAAYGNGSCQELVDVVANHSGGLFFIVIGGDMTARDYKRLIQSGNADWVAEAGAPQEIAEIIERVRAAKRELDSLEAPVVVSFVPSAGGVGNSTLAIETAIHLVAHKSAKNSRVALIDLDFQSSHICDYLDIVPKFQFDEIIGAPDRLDDQLLSAFISRHSSGLEVFAADRSRFHSRDLDVDALSALFDRMAHRYAYIIADLPLSVRPWTIPLLAASKGILVTGLNTIPSLRQMAETLRSLRTDCAVSGDVRAVVNRCDFGLLGNVVRADHVARILGDEKRLLVRNSRVALECVNIGTPMTLAYPSDKCVRDIAAIADYCTALKSEAPKPA